MTSILWCFQSLSSCDAIGTFSADGTRVVRNQFSAEEHMSSDQKTGNLFYTEVSVIRGNLPMRSTVVHDK